MLIMGFTIPAHAGVVTLDFLNDDPNGADSTAGERGELDGTILVFDGVYVMFSATSTTDPNGGYAYFDSGGGLGACGTLDGDQCDPSDDSPLTSGETLTISFFSDANGQNPLELAIDELLFRDGNHDLITSYSYLLGIDGGGMVSTAMDNGSASDSGSSFTFGYDGQEYYISSMVVSGPGIRSDAVPEPGVLALFGFGLMGLGVVRRRRLKK